MPDTAEPDEGVIVHVPDGNPPRSTLPVELAQLGWVIVPVEGAEGLVFTVSVAKLLFTLVQLLMTTALYLYPSSPVASLIDKVAVVTPLYTPLLLRSKNPLPPSACHLMKVAFVCVMLKLAAAPLQTDRVAGGSVTEGGAGTVSEP